ncbi:MAG: hypothetical protein HQ553_12565 [Chloroflexi bacterium]|nr:hypothetical protein [Chloroflexota bacterium]
MKRLALILSILLLFLSINCSDSSDDQEKEEITVFTCQVLVIEYKRDLLLQSFSDNNTWFANYLYREVGVDLTNGSHLPSVTVLKRELELLYCPAQLYEIKSGLVEVYRIEIEDAAGFNASVNQYNVNESDWGAESPWYQAQLLRRDLYILWEKTLAKYGLSLQSVSDECTIMW